MGTAGHPRPDLETVAAALRVEALRVVTDVVCVIGGSGQVQAAAPAVLVACVIFFEPVVGIDEVLGARADRLLDVLDVLAGFEIGEVVFGSAHGRYEGARFAVVGMDTRCEHDHADVVRALHASSRLPSLAHRWEEDADEQGDDRDNNEQFDERERFPAMHDDALQIKSERWIGVHGRRGHTVSDRSGAAEKYERRPKLVRRYRED